MRILFDQGTPVPLRRFLSSHTVATAYERGWSKVTNGDLIRLAEQAGDELPITTDALQEALLPQQALSS
jgi:acyl dehydratase